MIRKEELKDIGEIRRTHGLKGELNAAIDIDPDFFIDEENPVVIDIDGIFVPFFAESVRPKSNQTDLIKLEGIDSEEEARKFVNKEIYALKSSLTEYYEELDEDYMDPEDLEGYVVTDTEAGLLGTVKRVNDTTANVLLIVGGDNEDDEIFIPLAGAFITDINRENHSITTELPQELLNLNSTDSSAEE